jgi:hypothetical protein
MSNTVRAFRQDERLDSLTGIRGLYPSALFRRTGIMAANGCHPLPRHKQTTANPIASGPGTPPAIGYGWAIAKSSGGMMHAPKTTAACIVSCHRPSRRGPMSARAGPSAH